MANFDLIEFQKRVIEDLHDENRKLREQVNCLKDAFIKVQYHDEELTIPELCKRLENVQVENKALKDYIKKHLKGKCSECVHHLDLYRREKREECEDCYWHYSVSDRLLIEYLYDNWEWKGVDGK